MNPCCPERRFGLYPCDLCHASGIGWIDGPTKGLRYMRHSSQYGGKRINEISKLWLCKKHQEIILQEGK